MLNQPKFSFLSPNNTTSPKEFCIEELLSYNNEANIQFLRLQFLDIQGIPKNIVIPATRLEEALDEGIPFDGSSIAGYATIEESDKIAKPDPTTYTILPAELTPHPTAKLNCDIYEPNGRRFAGDTKYVLEKTMKQAEEQGFLYNTGPECEFFLFKKNGDNSTLIPNDTGGYFDLSHRDLAEGVRAEISLTLQQLDITTHTAHHEVSDGQHEINFCYADALTTADRIITLKYVTKTIANHHNLHASFMPKPLQEKAGCGMHTHQSLFTKENDNVFSDEQNNTLSSTAFSYIAGTLHHIKEITAVLNPCVNSYKRLVPGYEAPTYISWAHKNRSALIRIPAGRNTNSKRMELRSPDLSGNPYLQFALMLAAGLEGIKHNMQPPEPVEKNIYELTETQRKKHGIEHLPGSLRHALTLMEESDFVKKVLGEHIYNNFLHVKKQEWESYRTQVSPWEIQRYLHVI